MEIANLWKTSALLIVVMLLTINVSAGLQKSNQIDISSNNNKTISVAPYDLLIVAPPLFCKYLKPLVKHKNEHGINTIIVDIEEVYDQMYWYGRDPAEKLKYFIKTALENWQIKYVLLVGGRKNQLREETWWIPVRYSHLNRNYDHLVETRFLSDLYFGDIYDENGSFSSWDDNNNGIFGEWLKNGSAVDFPDLYPDVSVGRLPCRNIFDVITSVHKIIKYESGRFADSWFKKMVAVAGDTYPEKTDYADGEVYTQMGFDVMQGFEPVKLWTSDGSLKKGIDVVRALNKGCGFVWFSGHGNAATWVTHPLNDSSWVGYFQRYHMKLIRNRNMLPVVISGSGCFVSMFNVSLRYSPRVYWKGVFKYNIPSCWSWTFAKELGGGGIGVIGSTGFSYESPDIDSGVGGCELLDLGFFKAYGLYNLTVLGDCWSSSITQFLDSHPIVWSDTSPTGDALIVKNAEQWLLIGDPSLRIGGIQ